MFAFSLTRLRWCLVLQVVSLSSCGGYGEIDAKKDAPTGLLTGDGELSRDRRFALFSVRNTVGVWDDSSHKLRYRALPAYCWGWVFWGPDSRQFVVPAYSSGGVADQLLFVNTVDLSIEKRLTFPRHPNILCFFGPGVFGSSEGPRGEDLASPFTLFRVENDRVVAMRTLEHPAGDYDVLCAVRITNQFGLFCTRLLPHAAKVKTPCLDDAPRNQDEKTKLRIEACVFDVVSGRLVHRLAAPAPPLAPWSHIRVAGNGRHALFCSDDAIEVRELPSLKLRGKLNTKDQLGADDRGVLSIALSQDARYVAFGGDRLHLWDTTLARVYTLDTMNSNTLRAKQGWLFGSDYGADYSARLQYCLADIKFMDDSSKFAVLTHDGTYAVWDAKSRVCVRRERIANVIYMAEDACYLWYPSRWCFGFFVVYSVAALCWWLRRYRRSLIPMRLSRRSATVTLALLGIGLSILVSALALWGETWIWQPSHAYIFVFPAYSVIALSSWLLWYRRSLMRLQFSLGSIFVLVTLCAVGLSILAPAFR